MAVSRSLQNVNVAIDPPYNRVEKLSATQIIVTDMITSIAGDEDVSSGTFIFNKRILWLKITGDRIYVLNQQPATLPQTTHTHNDWARTRLIKKGEKTFVVKYDTSGILDALHRESVFLYEMSAPASDEIIANVNQDDDWLKLYI